LFCFGGLLSAQNIEDDFKKAFSNADLELSYNLITTEYFTNGSNAKVTSVYYYSRLGLSYMSFETNFSVTGRDFAISVNFEKKEVYFQEMSRVYRRDLEVVRVSKLEERLYTYTDGSDSSSVSFDGDNIRKYTIYLSDDVLTHVVLSFDIAESKILEEEFYYQNDGVTSSSNQWKTTMTYDYCERKNEDSVFFRSSYLTKKAGKYKLVEKYSDFKLIIL
jgi:hypothetical protein